MGVEMTVRIQQGWNVKHVRVHRQQMLTMLKLEPCAHTHAVRSVQSDDDTGLQEKTRQSVRATGGVLHSLRRFNVVFL